MKKFTVWTAAMAIVLSAFVSTAMAGAVGIKFGWAETAEKTGHPLSLAAYTFKEVAEKESNGRLQVDLFPAAQLGDAKSMLQQVDRGIIEMCSSIPNGMFASSYYDNLNFLDIPFLFKNDQQAFDLLNPGSGFFKGLADDIGKAVRVRPVYFTVEGGRHITNSKREIRTPADLKGLKIRTMEVPAHMTMFEAMGASPTPIAWTELYTALQTGVVDGQENPILNCVYITAWEVQKYMTLDAHVTLCSMTVMNSDFYSGLDDELKLAVGKAALAASTAQYNFMRENQDANLQLLKDKGLQVYQPAPAEIEQFKAVTREKVIPYLKSTMANPDLIDEVLKQVDE